MSSNDPPSTPGEPSRGPVAPDPLPYTDDESRVRRRQRIAARRDVPPPAGVRTPHGRALRARAWATDRQGRFERRLEEVRADVERREQRRARMETAIVAGIGVVGIAAALLAGIWLEPPVAAIAGVFLVVLVLGGRRGASKYAQSRGPDAWDWQAGKYRAIGRPARRVQQADAPPPTDPRGRSDRR